MEKSRLLGCKSLTLLTVCIFFVSYQYFIVEDTISVLDYNAARINITPPHIHQDSPTSTSNKSFIANALSQPQDTTEKPESQTYITMGLCWSENAQVHHKENFPYKEAAPLSAQLWMKFTPAKVILQIVYSEPEISEELSNYKKELEKYGTLVYLAPTGSDMKCVLKSQMIRLVAYSLPFIQDQDIIVTADVDAFVMTSDIYKPLKLLDRQIWIYRYANTLVTNATFQMPFIAIRKSVWKTLFDYDSSQDIPENGLLGTGLPQMIDNYAKKLVKFSSNTSWDIDQDIFTHEILNSGLCSLPEDHILWDKLHIDHSIPRGFNDSKTCWHGGGVYEDCNNNMSMGRNLKIRYYGKSCKWWHFFPKENYTQLKEKFDEIMQGKSENSLVNYILKTAKTFQLDLSKEESNS